MDKNVERYRWLMKLYRKMFNSAEFESDFASNWNEVYNIMKKGTTDQIPSFIIAMCGIYLENWEKENESNVTMVAY